jgi:Zn-dependent protease
VLSALQPRSLIRRIWAPIAVIGAILLKFKTVGAALLKVKFLGGALSMLVSVAGYAVFWGWRFAVGFVILLLLHELGHVAEARRQGLDTGGVYFIPFLGAVMLLKEHSQDAAKAAWLGLAGPILGSAAAFATWGLGILLDSDLLVALAFTGFLLNLFNLIPVFPLDGGWVTAVFHPLFWGLGLIGLALLFFVIPSPIIPIIVLVGAFELWKRLRGRGAYPPGYHDVPDGQRTMLAVAYLSLAAILAMGMSATHEARELDGTLKDATIVLEHRVATVGVVPARRRTE